MDPAYYQMGIGALDVYQRNQNEANRLRQEERLRQEDQLLKLIAMQNQQMQVQRAPAPYYQQHQPASGYNTPQPNVNFVDNQSRRPSHMGNNPYYYGGY